MPKKITMLVVLLLAAAGLWAAFRPTPHGTGPSPASGAQASVPVVAAQASLRDVPLFLKGLGNVQAFNTVLIRSQVDGQLIKIAFKEGQEVHAGDLLAQVDPRTYQAALDQAVAKKAQDEAQLANARRDLARYAGLAEKNYIAHQQLDTTQALVAQLQAAVQGDAAAIENAKVLLDYTSIRAPIDGKTGIRQVDVGNIVKATDATGIVTLTQIHPISAVFTLPEGDVAQVVAALAEDSPPKVTVLSRDEQQVLDEGTLQLVDNQIDAATATARLKATLPNKKGALWPGEFINVKVKVATLHQVVTVPAAAVQRGPNGAFAFVVKDDATVDMRPLSVGDISEGVAVIENGIKDGEQVVVEGHYRLHPGSRVEAKMADAAAVREKRR
jgi:multidrug efflux system membrane fusion protein